MVNDEVKDARRFFSLDVPACEPVASIYTGEPKRKSDAGEIKVDFCDFYETAIKGRVRRKLEEEALGGCEGKEEAEAEVNGKENEDDDEEHPKVILIEETDAEGEGEDKPAPKKLPRRRPATTNFPLLG